VVQKPRKAFLREESRRRRVVQKPRKPFKGHAVLLPEEEKEEEEGVTWFLIFFAGA